MFEEGRERRLVEREKKELEELLVGRERKMGTKVCRRKLLREEEGLLEIVGRGRFEGGNQLGKRKKSGI